MSNAPKFRLVAARKDKEDITFVDYKGNEVTKKYMPIGVVFEGPDGKLSLKFENTFKRVDNENFWYNIYTNDNNGPARGGSKGTAARKPAPKGDSRDVSDDF